MPAPNVFLDPGPAAREQIENIAENLAKLANVLPASTQADEHSYYACAEGSDVTTTQRELLKRTGFVCVTARAAGWQDVTLTAELIRHIHEGIFRPVFGDATLGYRHPPRREEHQQDDGVVFPIWVVGNGGSQPTIVTKRGVQANQVMRRVREACAAFENSVPQARGDVDRGALAVTQLYVRLIRIHPFGDGNGRTAWAALQFAAGRVRFPFVQSTPTAEARLALGDALRNGNEIARLVEHVKAAAWDH